MNCGILVPMWSLKFLFAQTCWSAFIVSICCMLNVLFRYKAMLSVVLCELSKAWIDTQLMCLGGSVSRAIKQERRCPGMSYSQSMKKPWHTHREWKNKEQEWRPGDQLTLLKGTIGLWGPQLLDYAGTLDAHLRPHASSAGTLISSFLGMPL